MSLGLETLAIALCVEHGDDEEAQQRVIGMAISGATCKEDVLDILEFIADELSLGTFI